MNPLFPFLYQHQVNQLTYLPEKTIIQAGPGMGKSVFIGRVHDAFQQEGKAAVFISSSKNNRKEAAKNIIDWCTSDNDSILLVDNLHFVYDDKIENEFRNLNSTEERIVIVTSSTPSRASFLGSGRYGLNEYKEKDNHPSPFNTKLNGSLGLSPFASMWLSPWDGQWQNRIKETIRSVLNNHMTNIEKMVGQEKIKDFLTEDIQTYCIDKILDISGGHPILLHRTINTFVRELVSEYTNEATNTNNAFVSSLFSGISTSLMENCSPRIYKALEWAEYLLPYDVYRSTLNELLNQEEPSNDYGKRVLHQAGIICEKTDKNDFVCEIIKEITKNRLSMLSTSSVPHRSFNSECKVMLKPRSADNLIGNIVCKAAGMADIVIELSPTEWDIIVELEKKEGKLVTVKELIKTLNTDTEASIRSALQRLTGKLANAKLQAVITNIPRKGYSYNTTIVLTQNER
ncbi:MAG: helix-turn-helix domain-containing protein [Thiotrichaceae bacterium]